MIINISRNFPTDSFQVFGDSNIPKTFNNFEDMVRFLAAEFGSSYVDHEDRLRELLKEMDDLL